VEHSDGVLFAEWSEAAAAKYPTRQPMTKLGAWAPIQTSSRAVVFLVWQQLLFISMHEVSHEILLQQSYNAAHQEVHISTVHISTVIQQKQTAHTIHPDPTFSTRLVSHLDAQSSDWSQTAKVSKRSRVILGPQSTKCCFAIEFWARNVINGTYSQTYLIWWIRLVV
jgi:hypothetical protein